MGFGPDVNPDDIRRERRPLTSGALEAAEGMGPCCVGLRMHPKGRKLFVRERKTNELRALGIVL